MTLISQKLKMSLQALEALNPQVKPPAYQLNIGDVLQTSASSSGPGPNTGPASKGTYTVKSGDNMSLISQNLGIPLQALEAANPQVRPPEFKLNVGDILQIPGGSGQSAGTTVGPSAGPNPTPGGTTNSGTYVVQSGDSMDSISRKLGITLQALEVANPQVKGPAFQIKPGDVLQTTGGKQGGNGSGSGGNSHTYTVVAGNTMSSIAAARGISLQALEAANPQVKPPKFELAVGQVITIP
ncbi:carbohydrate-binding module family 50 protein [Stipitochalara longipes BDJ]|nr:carbohydrate-binding module family 50 protein [Stipitochalara longipes BDJ]